MGCGRRVNGAMLRHLATNDWQAVSTSYWEARHLQLASMSVAKRVKADGRNLSYRPVGAIGTAAICWFFLKPIGIKQHAKNAKPSDCPSGHHGNLFAR